MNTHVFFISNVYIALKIAQSYHKSQSQKNRPKRFQCLRLNGFRIPHNFRNCKAFAVFSEIFDSPFNGVKRRQMMNFTYEKT